MAEETTGLQEGAVPEGTTSVEETPQEQPLTKESVAQMVAEQTEAIKRSFQSEKDRAIAQSQREAADRVRAAEERVSQLMQQVEPGVISDLQAADAARELQEYKRREKAQQWDKEFRDLANTVLENAGVAVEDKRIDWGEETETYEKRLKKIATSIKPIREGEVKSLEARLLQQVKDQIAQERKEAGWDSAGPSSGGSSGFPFPLTNEAIGNLTYDEWKPWKDKLDEAERKGLIK